MDALIKKTWKVAASVRLTFVLMSAMCVCSGWGYFLIRDHVNLFKPLQDISLISWARTWGAAHLTHTWWFFALMTMLALLAVNTFVCTTDRTIAIWRSRKKFTGAYAFSMRLSPHIMHYALIIILLGYLSSYLFASTVSTVILLPGRETSIENTKITIMLKDMKLDFYKGKRMEAFEGRALDVTGFLVFKDNRGRQKETNIGINKPARFQGLSVHLSSFAPKSNTSMVKRKYMNATVRRDPGIFIYYAGMFLFVLGLFLYVLSFTPAGEIRLRGNNVQHQEL